MNTLPYVEHKHAKIYYTAEGKGSAVVLLHGFLETSNMWQGFVPELAKRHRVVCIDLPGHGNSDCLSYIHTMDDMAGCVRAVLQDLNIRKIKVIGHSMGGYVALALADLFPDYINGLCLFFSTSKADSAQKKKDRSRAIAIVKENHKSFIRMALPMLFRSKYRKTKKNEIKAAKQDALRTSKQGVVAALEGMKRRPSREILLKFPPYPIHIISGQRDPVIAIESMHEQMNRSENVKGIILKEPGHMGHIEDPENCLKEIKRFLKR